jgi:hypothetical protein
MWVDMDVFFILRHDTTKPFLVTTKKDFVGLECNAEPGGYYSAIWMLAHSTPLIGGREKFF